MNDAHGNTDPTPTTPRTMSRLVSVIWPAAVGVAVLLTYAGTLHNGFVFDDRIIVVVNGQQWQKESLWRLFRHDYWGEQRIDVLYRPITTISHALLYRMSGEHPEAHRAVNIGLHIACCWCLLALTRALFGDRSLAGMATILFAVHAIHVEPVAQIVGRAELLAALWMLIALWLYCGIPREGGGFSRWRYGAVLLSSLLAMLSKESGICIVGLIVAYDLWSRRYGPFSGDVVTPSARRRSREVVTRTVLLRLFVRRWSGLIVVALIVLVIRYQVLGRVSRSADAIPKLDNPIVDASLEGRIATPLVLLGKYVRLLIWPHPLCCDYSYDALPVCESVLQPGALWGLACLAAMVIAAAASYRGKGHLLWCVIFFLVSYFLVSNSGILIGTIFAERLMYFPSIAFCWALATGVLAAANGLARHMHSTRAGWIAAGGLFACLCAVNMVLAVHRGHVWRDERRLLTSALALTQRSARVHAQIGILALADRDYAGAVRHLTRAVEILDDYPQANFNLGKAYVLSGQPEKAIPYLKKVLHTLPRELRSKPRQFLGQAYLDMNLPSMAIAWFAEADRFEPNAPPILALWVRAALLAGSHEQAIHVLRRAIKVTPKGNPLHDTFENQLRQLLDSPAPSPSSATR